MRPVPSKNIQLPRYDLIEPSITVVLQKIPFLCITVIFGAAKNTVVHYVYLLSNIKNTLLVQYVYLVSHKK